MIYGDLRSAPQSLLFALEQLSLRLTEGAPATPFGDQTARRNGGLRRAPGAGIGLSGRARVLDRFVFLEKALKLAMRVSAGAGQVLFGIRQLILLEVQFSLGELNLFPQRVLIALRGAGGLCGQLLDLLLVCLDLGLSLVDSVYDSPRFRGLRARLLVCGAQGVGESQVNLMVGQPNSVPGLLLLLASCRQGRQLLGSVEYLFVNHGSLIGKRPAPPLARRF